MATINYYVLLNVVCKENNLVISFDYIVWRLIALLYTSEVVRIWKILQLNNILKY